MTSISKSEQKRLNDLLKDKTSGIYHVGDIVTSARERCNTFRKFVKIINRAEYLYKSTEKRLNYISSQIEITLSAIEKTLIGEWWLLVGAFDIDDPDPEIPEHQIGVVNLNAEQGDDVLFEFIRSTESSRGFQFAEEMLIEFLQEYDLIKYLNLYKDSLVDPITREDFMALFQNTDHVEMVEKRLDLLGYTVKGIWRKSPGECASLYKAISPILKSGDKTSRGRIFVKYFRVKISDRSLREDNITAAFEEFKQQFKEILPE